MNLQRRPNDEIRYNPPCGCTRASGNRGYRLFRDSETSQKRETLTSDRQSLRIPVNALPLRRAPWAEKPWATAPATRRPEQNASPRSAFRNSGSRTRPVHAPWRSHTAEHAMQVSNREPPEETATSTWAPSYGHCVRFMPRYSARAARTCSAGWKARFRNRARAPTMFPAPQPPLFAVAVRRLRFTHCHSRRRRRRVRMDPAPGVGTGSSHW